MSISVEIETGQGSQHIFTTGSPLTVSQVRERLHRETGLSQDDFYITHNGRLAYVTDVLSEGRATIVPRLLGGKGGFGSMLRAIGAQIEKTTNREACRDLSGRRLRDINEEKRLKAWIEKQSTREEEAAERKKRKLEKLCAEPKYEFKDQTYERERSILIERVGDAVEQGFKASLGESSGVKRKTEEEFKPNKRKTIMDLDIDSDELDSSDESSSEDNVNNKKKVETEVSNDSGHSSDESNKLNKNSDCVENNVKLSPTEEETREETDNSTDLNNEESNKATECTNDLAKSSNVSDDQALDRAEEIQNDSSKDSVETDDALVEPSVSA